MRTRTAIAAAILFAGLVATTGCSYHYEVKCQQGQGCTKSESHDDSNSYNGGGYSGGYKGGGYKGSSHGSSHSSSHGGGHGGGR